MPMSESPKWNVEFFQDARGNRPVEEWLLELDNKDRSRVRRTFDLLAVYGLHLGMPHSRHLRGKVWELRVATGRQDYRVLYFAAVGRRFVLLHAFSKKTAKTPEREFEIADRRLAEFQARTEKGS